MIQFTIQKLLCYQEASRRKECPKVIARLLCNFRDSLAACSRSLGTGQRDYHGKRHRFERSRDSKRFGHVNQPRHQSIQGDRLEQHWSLQVSQPRRWHIHTRRDCANLSEIHQNRNRGERRSDRRSGSAS